MQCSPEKLAANRANGAKSNGPKTEAGKAVSRCNAITHGFTGAGIALPDEDAPAVEAAFNQHKEEMQPRTRAGAAIVYQFAWATLKLQRFRMAHTATTSQHILDAGHAFDDAQFARLDEAKARLIASPKAQLAVLSRFQVGADWVLEAWGALSCALSSGMLKNWRQAQFDLFQALLGHSPEFPSYDDTTFWNLAAMGDPSVLDNREMFAGNSPAARCQDARDKMIALCDQEMEKWEAILETATVATGIARENAIKSARYDASKEGQLARKYEAAITRELNKALKDFKVVEAEFAEAEPVVETAEPVETCVELGSFLLGPDPVANLPETEVWQPSATPIPVAQPFPIPISDRSEPSSTPIHALKTDESRRS